MPYKKNIHGYNFLKMGFFPIYFLLFVPTFVWAQTSTPCVNHIVFGFLNGYERGNYSNFSNLQWDLLTHIVDFSVDMNADGTFNNSSNLPTSGLISTAISHGVM